MYKALYRTYRPTTFSDVIGQPYIVRALRNQVAQGQTGHAYLFTGVRGTGKTTCARILAKAVNCLSPVDGEPCGKCSSCKAIDEGRVTDICEIDAASNNGVDSIRDLRDEVAFAPSEVKYRVYIIDEVHMLSGQAFNALLKTLEEPPPHIKFILATTEIHKMPVTIVSRCQRYDFRRIAAEEIASLLQQIAEKESIPLTRDGSLMLAGIADGAMRDAISALELCAGLNEEINADVVRRTLGIASGEHIYQLAEAFLARDIKQAASVFEWVYAEGIDPERLCGELLEFYRDALMAKMTGSSQDERTAEYSGRADYGHIGACIEAVQSCFERMGRSVSPRVEMQLLIVRLCRTESASAAATVPAQPAAAYVQPATKQEPAPASVPAPARESAASGTALAEWVDIIAELAKTDPALAAMLVGSVAVTEADRINISFPDPTFEESVRQELKRTDKDSKRLRNAVDTVLGAGHPYIKMSIVRYQKAESPSQLSPLDRILSDAQSRDIPVTED